MNNQNINNNKLDLFWTRLFSYMAFFGYFINEPTKSSLIGEKSPNLVTLVPRWGYLSVGATIESSLKF
jgi:hypothetical protein